MRTSESDSVLTVITEACKKLEFPPTCIKCQRSFAKIRQENDGGLPIILTVEGPVCSQCRKGAKPVALLASTPNVKVFLSGGSAAPHASIAKSGLFTLNRPAVDMFGLPANGYLVIGWREETRDIIVGLGKEGLPGARAYQRKTNAGISFQIKNFLLAFGLDIDNVCSSSPWVPYYEEETGYIVVPIGK